MPKLHLFGRIALRKGLVSESQLHRAVRLQEEVRSLGVAKHLGEILVADGVLAPEQVEQVLRLQAINEKAAYERRYGRVALKNGLIDPEQLEAALEVLQREGFQRSLSTILREQGVLTGRAARAIHAALDRAVAEEVGGEAPPERPRTPSSERLLRSLDLAGEEADADAAARAELARRQRDLTFGAVALREGLVLVPELERAVEEQTIREEDVPLAQVLVERGVLSEGEVAAVEAAVAVSRHETLRIPGYEVRDVLGYGVTSVVLRARHEVLAREVAIKLFRAEHVAAATAETLLEEARAVASVRHPNVVGLYEVGRVHRRVFFVMELVDGPTLMEVLRQQGPLPLPDVVRLARDLARGLAAIHEPGLVHRDVKPQNVLFAGDGGAKLTDLGLACEAGFSAAEDGAGALYGSPYTMSPEQAQGDAVDARADLYGLGATLYYALTGGPPYEGQDTVSLIMAHCTAPVPDPVALRADADPGLARLIMRLLAKEPEQRPSNAHEVLGALEALS